MSWVEVYGAGWRWVHGLVTPVQNNVTTADFGSNLTASICLLLAMQTLSDLTSKRQSVFLVDLEQVFYEICLGRKSLFHFFKIKVYYTFLQE